MNTGEIAALDALDLLVVVDNESDTQLQSLLKRLFAKYLEEMKGQYVCSVRWYGLIERV